MTHTGEEIKEEISQLCGLFSNGEVYKILQSQFLSIFQRTTSIFVFAGALISVVGFSGHRIAQAGKISSGSLLIGLGLILISIMISCFSIFKLRWMSSFSGDHQKMFYQIIQMRNQKMTLLRRSFFIFMCGLFFYIVSIVNYILYLMNHQVI